MEHKLYGGKVSLSFDPDKHKYNVGGELIAGVTTILQVLAKPALIIWAANEAAKYVAENLKPGVALDEVQIKDLCDGAKSAHRKKKDKAADIGHMVHEWCEKYANGENPDMPQNEEMLNAVNAFLRFVETHKVKFLSSERVILSQKYGFAGTCDFIAEVDGHKIVGDLKTGSGIYDEYAYQTAAYQIALEEELEEKYEGNMIVNIRKDGVLETKLVEPNEVEKNKQAFIACLLIHNRNKELKSLKE